jgi:tetraacyldisaccharide 4'-kinase
VRQALQQTWLRRGVIARLLWPLAFCHGLLVRLRHFFYRVQCLSSERFAVPVLVVGNVVAGGAGKTPAVMALVQHLQKKGLHIGVVSRGYGRQAQDCLEVLPSTPVADSGDEPALIQRTTAAPVFVAARRVAAVRALLLAHPSTQVIVCDDGLQHYALARDLEIAVFDERGVGNGWLLPAGPLREPWPARQHQSVRGPGVDLVLHTGTRAAFEGFRSSRRLADHALRADGSRVALDSLRGQPLRALAGIANPDGFFRMLRDAGLTLADTLALPDHCSFDEDLPFLGQGYTVLCTEKDAVKLFARQANVLAVPLLFEPEPAFFSALDVLLQPLLSPVPSTYGHQTS